MPHIFSFMSIRQQKTTQSHHPLVMRLVQLPIGHLFMLHGSRDLSILTIDLAHWLTAWTGYYTARYPFGQYLEPVENKREDC